MESTHTGSCHCQAIQFTATVDVTKVSRCNCTVCTKLGTLGCLTKPAKVELTKGEPALYPNSIGARYFCATCGTHLFLRGDLPEMGGPFASVNVQALDDVDPYVLSPVHWDGRHDNWEAGPRPAPYPIFRTS
jgi:hypothetical protein